MSISRLAAFSLRAILCATPWLIRKPLLSLFFGYQFAGGARISAFSWIYPEVLVMGPNSRISALNVAIHMHRLVLGENASIGRGNWMTGHPKASRSSFVHCECRDPSLLLGRHSAITKSHIIDCTDRIDIGEFSTIAGYRSQFLTHSLDIYMSRQDCKPIVVGNYCFIGTSCIVLGGSVLPDFSVLGALSLLNTKFGEEYTLYAGSPACRVKQLPPMARYFQRSKGYVD